MGQFQKQENKQRNPDPITGAPGAHPVGVGIGTAGGAAAGAAIGAVGGPVGAVIGAIAGGVAGGLGGKAAAEAIDPTAENAYWQENYKTRHYVSPGAAYDDYQPAYRYGWESRGRHGDKHYSEVEPSLESGWHKAKANSTLGWEKAKLAVRDAWERVDQSGGRHDQCH
jgi:hypothetical protein